MQYNTTLPVIQHNTTRNTTQDHPQHTWTCISPHSPHACGNSLVHTCPTQKIVTRGLCEGVRVCMGEGEGIWEGGREGGPAVASSNRTRCKGVYCFYSTPPSLPHLLQRCDCTPHPTPPVNPCCAAPAPCCDTRAHVPHHQGWLSRNLLVHHSALDHILCESVLGGGCRCVWGGGEVVCVSTWVCIQCVAVVCNSR